MSLFISSSSSDGQTTANEDSIRDGVFGTSGDSVNLKTQYSNCSHRQLNFGSVGNVQGNTLKIKDGVITINLPKRKKNDGSNAIRNAITSVIETEFGQQPFDIADHIMYCLPPGIMSGIAFAGVNSWYSVYSDEWCGYSAVQMHEIGHNINLAHSGEGTGEYADQSGNMGFSYREDDTLMCFNSAKSWQLGWYSSSAVTIDVSGNRAYEGDIAGIVEDQLTANVTRVVKLNTPIGDDYFLNFNRRFSFNSGTKEGANQVMITKAGKEGNGFSQSWLQAKLSADESWTSPAVFDNEAVTVTVKSVGIRANVQICVGTCPTVTGTPTASPSVTGAPSTPPTASPVAAPDVPSLSPTASPVAATGTPITLPTVSPVVARKKIKKQSSRA